MERLRAGAVSLIRAATRAADANLFFLPPYSPDLNPIEQVFAKLKHALRNAAGRSIDTTSNAIAAALKTFSPAECQNYLANSGYLRRAHIML